jgi:hypothetical protein
VGAPVGVELEPERERERVSKGIGKASRRVVQTYSCFRWVNQLDPRALAVSPRGESYITRLWTRPCVYERK